MAIKTAVIPKTTLVLGASKNPGRYSYIAIASLLKHGHKPIPMGKAPGQVHGLTILAPHATITDPIDTVSIYLHPSHQQEYVDYLLALKPKRVIFNPGAENPTIEETLKKHGIETMEACTLVLLSTHAF